MRKLLFFVLMMSFFVFAGCGDSGTKSDEDQTNDSDTVADDTDETGDTGDDADTDGTGTCATLDSEWMEPEEGWASWAYLKMMGPIADYDGDFQAAVFTDGKMKVTSGTTEFADGGFMNYQSSTLLAMLTTYEFTDVDEVAGTAVVDYWDSIYQFSQQLVPVLKEEKVREAGFGASTFLRHTYIDVTYDTGTGAVTSDQTRKGCFVAISKTEEYIEDGKTYNIPVGDMYGCFDDNVDGSVGEDLKMMFKNELLDDAASILKDLNTQSDGSVLEYGEEGFMHVCSCFDEEGTEVPCWGYDGPGGAEECPDYVPEDECVVPETDDDVIPDTDTDDVEDDVVPDDDVVDPCDPNPCTSKTNSDGNCTADGADFSCGCNTNYTWNATTEECEADPVDPCDPSPCDASEPICIVDAGETEGYKCYPEHLEITGEYTDNFDGTQIIGPAIWDQGATMGKFNISTWDNDNNFLIAQNDSGNGFNPEKWSRFDWTSDGTDVYFCQTIYDAATAQDAIDATPADSGDLLTGCNTFSWTKLIHIPMDILGEHKSGTDPYITDHVVTFGKWDQGAMMGAFNFKARYNTEKFAIAQNDSGNGYNSEKWSRFDWTVSEGSTYYCQTVYDAERFEDAYNATPADSGDLAAGCGGFSWSEFTDEGLEIIGVYQSGSDPYVTDHIISQTIWDQGAAMGSFNIAAYFNAEGYLIAQNDSGNGFNPEKWSRFDWTMDGDNLYYCQSTYDAENIADAFLSSPADAGDLSTGCGGFSWSLLTPVVEESLDKASGDIAAWAATNVSFTQGSEATGYDDPSKALGVAEGTSTDIVCLGRGGSIVLGFTTPITNGAGPDFAVFENSLNDTFLELGYVEVSSDGTNFIRFDTYYLGTEPVDAFGGHDAALIWGFAGKFMQGKGTQFDLEDLADRAEVTGGTVDLDAITHVKIIDVIGDGSELDSLGNPIYDPYPTTGTAGFDLDAVAVINEVVD